MVYRALVVDIDGTITHRDRRLNFEAARLLHELSIPVVLATGNILCYALAAAKMIGLEGTVIAENGGVLSMGLDTDPYVSDHMDECERAFTHLSKYYELTKLDPENRRTEIALRRNVDTSALREVLAAHDPGVEIVDTKYAIHIKSTAINKGTGLVRMAGMLGLDANDFIAIGDSLNDVEMIRVAGYGIAVANGDPDIKDVADHVTAAPYGDGAAEAIEYVISEGLI
ncbi:MAG: phosphoglycolate phosphatase [Euryarchaeota archaeon]|nr:phosphoglycolate phosphatase [Euryarchaeota archaeon]